MKIVVAPLAARDIREAYEFIARDNPAAADRAILEIAECLGLLASGHLKGPDVKLRDGRRVFAWTHPPYRIYYRIFQDELQVIRVYHQSRRPVE